MINVTNLSKSFDGFQVLSNLNVNVKNGSIYGLVGTNGAGKTTLIKHITGVFCQDTGEISINGEPVYENDLIKRTIGYIPDDLYFFSMYNLKDSAKFYQKIYPNWNEDRYKDMVKLFNLNETKRLNKFSKGMQKQAAFILTMSTMPEVLILDEPIDGLDPIVRKMVWKLIVEDVAEREISVLISSHNLRELEGICDSIGILRNGEMIIERDLDELKSDIHKIQVSYENLPDLIYQKLNILYRERRGSVDLLIIRGKQMDVEKILKEGNPLILDLLPLSLEEIFIYELGGDNSEIDSIIF